ncbi:MAG TPA: hypothetical protein VK444_08110 [Methanobacteriaceae archaeon]|nr:hypothetical protein [Methanobacteriaceae archaeon]
MDFDEDLPDFSLICPECGVGNPPESVNCLVCDKDLENTVAFMEDDSFDLELTSELLIEYRKNFWGTRRTGKVNQYGLDEMENLEFGEKISRFKFDYHGKKIVMPLRTENMEKLKLLLLK